MVRSVTTIWPRCGRTGAVKPDHRRERMVAVAGGEHDLPGADRRPAASTAGIRRRCWSIADDRSLGEIVDAELPHDRRGRRGSSAQRIHVAVERTDSCRPTTSGPISGSIFLTSAPISISYAVVAPCPAGCAAR